MLFSQDFLVAQMVKNLSAVQKTQVPSLDWEDPLETEMAIHSSILAWRIPGTEEPGGLQPMGLQRVGHDWATNTTITTCYYPMARDQTCAPCIGRQSFSHCAAREVPQSGFKNITVKLWWVDSWVQQEIGETYLLHSPRWGEWWFISGRLHWRSGK